MDSFNKLLGLARACRSRPSHDFEMAVELVGKFCKLNHIHPPGILFKELTHRGEYVRVNGGLVYIDHWNCKWSWWSKPGNKADVTTFGVMCHELGHHWHYEAYGSWQAGMRAWKKGGKHRSITSYANMNSSEQLAEAFRLFVLNPRRLLELSPASARLFSKAGLRHPELKRSDL